MADETPWIFPPPSVGPSPPPAPSFVAVWNDQGRIFYTSPEYPGGGEVDVEELARALRREVWRFVSGRDAK